MKGQLLVAQLPVLLEQRAAHHRFRRQAVSSGLLDPVPAQITDHQTQQRTVFVEPLRDGFQLAADLVLRENLKYRGLYDAFLTMVELPMVSGFAAHSMACLRTISENRRLDPREILTARTRYSPRRRLSSSSAAGLVV